MSGSLLYLGRFPLVAGLSCSTAVTIQLINCDNPNTFAGLVGKVRKKLSPEGGRKGGWRKKARAARPPDPGLEPGTCRVLGEGPPLHARGAV